MDGCLGMGGGLHAMGVIMADRHLARRPFGSLKYRVRMLSDYLQYL